MVFNFLGDFCLEEEKIYDFYFIFWNSFGTDFIDCSSLLILTGTDPGRIALHIND